MKNISHLVPCTKPPSGSEFSCGWSETTETLVITGRGGWGRHHGTGIVILGKWEEAGLWLVASALFLNDLKEMALYLGAVPFHLSG